MLGRLPEPQLDEPKTCSLAISGSACDAALADGDLSLPGVDEVQVLTGLTDADAIIDWVDAQGSVRVG